MSVTRERDIRSLRRITEVEEPLTEEPITCTYDSASLGVVVFLAENLDERAPELRVAQPLRMSKLIDEDTLRCIRKAIRMMELHEVLSVEVKHEVDGKIVYPTHDLTVFVVLDQVDPDTVPGLVAQLIEEADNQADRLRAVRGRLNEAMAVHGWAGANSYR